MDTSTENGWNHDSEVAFDARKAAHAFGLLRDLERGEIRISASENVNRVTSFLNNPAELEEMKRILRTPGSIVQLSGPLLEDKGQPAFYNRPIYIELHQAKLQIAAIQKARGEPLRLRVTRLFWDGNVPLFYR